MARLRNRRGQGLVEYVLVLVLMALVAVGAVKKLGGQTRDAFDTAGDRLEEELKDAKGK